MGKKYSWIDPVRCIIDKPPKDVCITYRYLLSDRSMGVFKNYPNKIIESLPVIYDWNIQDVELHLIVYFENHCNDYIAFRFWDGEKWKPLYIDIMEEYDYIYNKMIKKEHVYILSDDHVLRY